MSVCDTLVLSMYMQINALLGMPVWDASLLSVPVGIIPCFTLVWGVIVLSLLVQGLSNVFAMLVHRLYQVPKRQHCMPLIPSASLHIQLLDSKYCLPVSFSHLPMSHHAAQDTSPLDLWAISDEHVTRSAIQRCNAGAALQLNILLPYVFVHLCASPKSATCAGW